MLSRRRIKHTLWLQFRRQTNSNFQLFYFSGIDYDVFYSQETGFLNRLFDGDSRARGI